MRECLLSGGLVMSGGLLGFAFSRNLTSLSTGVLYGGALLALSTLSMKIWRQGKSSFPYILGQAVLSAVTKKLFPAGLLAVILVTFFLCLFHCSAAMLCFYSYVVLSGGNPPPKKLKPSASPSY
uniref:Uncharacterized protein n=1 Tax=Brassica campestris TaxID=3711 RepID=A0A3P6CQI4_BRACM|nr:unnamed protein product [Brassica rapa]